MVKVYRRISDGKILGFGGVVDYEIPPALAAGCDITIEETPPVMPVVVPRKSPVELRLDALEADVTEMKKPK